jgi:hypothetical protein
MEGTFFFAPTVPVIGKRDSCREEERVQLLRWSRTRERTREKEGGDRRRAAYFVALLSPPP